MRSPTPPPASNHTIAAILAAAGIAAIVAIGATLLLLNSHAVPPEVIDGLTSPARFGARTT